MQIKLSQIGDAEETVEVIPIFHPTQEPVPAEEPLPQEEPVLVPQKEQTK